MRTLTIRIESRADFFRHARAAAKRIDAGGGYQGEGRSFETAALLFETLTPKRGGIVGRLQSLGPSSLRGLARSLGRDVKRVHDDVGVLLHEGIIERNDAKKLFVPFDSIRIEAEMKTLAA